MRKEKLLVFEIAGRVIGKGHAPYVIAELSGNHNGSLERAHRLIDEAARTGVDAIKLQTYTAETMTLDLDLPQFIVHAGPWAGTRLFELYKQAHTPFEWHEELFQHAREIGVTIFSSAFDETAVDLLESLDTPAYKIASFELVDLQLIRVIASTGKPIFISTGMASLGEVRDALDAAFGSGATEVTVFHCVSSYPAPADQSNLYRIASLKNELGVEVGLSDHTIGNLAAVAATALGAVAIEKHFTLDRSDGGPDSTFSAEPTELASLVHDVRLAWLALGSGSFDRQPTEEQSEVFRRSLYFVRDLASDCEITKDDIRCIRPGFGLAPKHLGLVIGRRTSRRVHRGEPVAWSDLQ